MIKKMHICPRCNKLRDILYKIPPIPGTTYINVGWYLCWFCANKEGLIDSVESKGKEGEIVFENCDT